MLDLVAEFFRNLKDTRGLNFTIFYDPFDRARFWSAFLTTVQLSVLSVAGSLVIGVIGAFVQKAAFRPLAWLVNGYIALFRNTPPLVQMYFFYFALGAVTPTMRDDIGMEVPLISNFTWALVSLSFFAGAFNVEIFRSGVEAIPKATVEAAEALGYSRLKAYIHIVLPLAFRVCLPALNNNLVNLIKTTTLAYAIGVPEMLYVANQIWSDTLNVPEMMNLLLFIYIALVSLLVWLMHRWEKAMRMPGYGN
ncbi:amino acid ABC transporter permease [Phreatobacter stygius]|uniref:Amino acid ABC transporter permease n=1 Tax=Phreatobacter stygius TaxID=1940610 RepID=A0A4D7B3Q4_9HYPH|nr:amino acid ABC transporter permease [Phreatobacter stygius]QCI65885.1 amino acid ABC transporter permease [Phreatobacter stygius]